MARLFFTVLILSFAAAPAYAQCVKPSAPVRPALPEAPEKPDCMKRGEECSKFRVREYDRRIEEYEREMERYDDRLEIFARQARVFAKRAKRYLACKNIK